MQEYKDLFLVGVAYLMSVICLLGIGGLVALLTAPY